ncbi:MAG: hypothetical protein QOD95_75 [Gammaproteobacteria bacterium]|nr:hypothetical protein [Gammaproteobacteria bacterium]
MTTQAASKGIALEIGKMPNLRPLSGPEEFFSASHRCVLYTATSKKRNGWRKLLRACQSIQESFRKQEDFPISVILLDLLMPHQGKSGKLLAESIRKAQASDQVVLFCDKELSRWSRLETTNFDQELESTIDFLSQLEDTDEYESATAPVAIDSERQLQLARERRDDLLASEKWIDASAVHAQQGGKSGAQGSNNTASRLRRGGELLGAWNGREFVHPIFQFQPITGRLMPEMKALLDILPKDRSGWRQSLWLFQRHGQLDGKRPADAFQKNPDLVIEAARSDFEVNDERW